MLNKKEMAIGFFDSGVGGLSVYARFKKLLPYENTIYYGDLKNLPYGNKTKAELIGFARNILDFFKKKGVKAVVIACNTSSALAYEVIKNEYNFEIYPIIQSCAKIIAEMDVKRIGVFATQGTVNASAYKTEINKYNPNIKILEIACPNWVSIVEGNYKKDKIADIKEYLDKMTTFQPEKIILGCTHYPYLLEDLTQFRPQNLFLDPAEIFVKYIEKDLRNKSLLTDSEISSNEEFYTSANPVLFKENAKLFYNLKKLPILTD